MYYILSQLADIAIPEGYAPIGSHGNKADRHRETKPMFVSDARGCRAFGECYVWNRRPFAARHFPKPSGFFGVHDSTD